MKKYKTIGLIISVIFVITLVYIYFAKNNNTPQFTNNNIYGNYYKNKITDIESARASVESVQDKIGFADINELSDGIENKSGTIFNTYAFNQYFNNVKYYGHGLITYTDKNGDAKGIINSYKKINDNFDATPKNSSKDLENIALEKVGKNSKISSSELIIWDLNETTQTLAYMYDVDYGISTAKVIINDTNKEILVYDDGIETLTDSELEKYKIDNSISAMFDKTENVTDLYAMLDKNRKIFMNEYNNNNSEYTYYTWNTAKDITSEEDFRLREDTINTVTKIYDYYYKTFNYKSFDGNGTNIDICTNVKKINENYFANNAGYSRNDTIFFGALNYFNTDIEVIRT